jgi:hypothetical protein
MNTASSRPGSVRLARSPPTNYWDSTGSQCFGWSGYWSTLHTDRRAKPLIRYRQSGARGIRTLVAGFPTNRISRPRELGAGRGMGGHRVFKIEVSRAPRGRPRHPHWDSVGSGAGAGGGHFERGKRANACNDIACVKTSCNCASAQAARHSHRTALHSRSSPSAAGYLWGLGQCVTQ